MHFGTAKDKVYKNIELSGAYKNNKPKKNLFTPELSSKYRDFPLWTFGCYSIEIEINTLFLIKLYPGA